MWRIELEAPQYPEGLMLQLHANKIAGQVDIINGLNHYIGMKTLHTEDFIEFQILPYIVILFGVFAVIGAIMAKRKLVVALLISLFTFVLLAGIDFYRWNYEYGHNLDPNAAIKVPGMAYQPPVLGYKQLLNFGAYSIPDVGGWILITAGTLIFLVVMKETKLLSRLRKKKKPAVKTMALLLLFSTLISCNNSEAQQIKLHKDRCNNCEMSISDGRFGAEIITQKGRTYKFDDVFCMLNYMKEKKVEFKSYYIHDYSKKNMLIDAKTAFYVKSETLNSPMRGNIAAFKDKNTAQKFADKNDCYVMKWSNL